MEHNLKIKDEDWPDDIEPCWENINCNNPSINNEISQIIQDNENGVQSINTDGQYVSTSTDIKTDEDILDEKTCFNNFMNSTIVIEDEVKIKPLGTYKCPICNILLNSNEALLSHIIIHNKTKRKFICNVCNQDFAYESHFKKHVQSHIISFKCTTCDLTFPSKEYLELHSEIHSVKTFKCVTCNKAFNSNAYLQQHLQKHKRIKPFKCTICNKTFISKTWLTKHLTVHNKIKSL